MVIIITIIICNKSNYYLTIIGILTNNRVLSNILNINSNFYYRKFLLMELFILMINITKRVLENCDYFIKFLST